MAQTIAERVWFRLLRLDTRLHALITERLKSIGLSVPQCDVLTTLTEREGVSQQELAARLYVTKGNISGLIDRLGASGMVERRRLDGDRRSHAIYLTPAGRAAAEAGIAAQKKFVAETLGRMSEAQLTDLDALLVAARDAVRASMRR